MLSDKACILYTFAIPWTDRDGFIEAEADYLKYNVVPRRKNIIEQDIPELVAEIAKGQLWDIYELKDGRKVVFVRKHEELQKKMKYDREKESTISPKINGLNPIDINSILNKSRTNHVQIPLKRKEKKGKEKKIKENSKEIFESLKALVSKIEKKFEKFNPYEAIQKMVNEGYLVEDIEPAFRYIVQTNDIRNPWACLRDIAKKGKNKREVIEREQDWEQKKAEDKRNVANLIKGIGKPI